MKTGSEPTERTGSVWLVGSDAPSARSIEQILAANAALTLKRKALEEFPLPGHTGIADAALIILDLDGFKENNIGGTGAQIVSKVTANAPCPTIVISSSGSLALVVDAMKNGAEDFLAKPFQPDQLRSRVEAALAEGNRSPVAGSRAGATEVSIDPLQANRNFQDFTGTSRAMQRVYKTIGNIAGSSASVFIQGESGTGKELCADALHRLSGRADGPLVSINCSAIPRDSMESEIFGHEAGAFTGATSERTGAAQQADGGTLFLDEICEMDLALQAKLLRFIQTGMVRRVGGSVDRKVDVRFVCATNHDPMASVQSGLFRTDLFYRLHVLPIVLPPLRDRDDDAVTIAEEMIGEIAREESSDLRRFDDDARQLIRSYHWPGNVRELLNVLRNVVVMNRGDTVNREMLAMALAHGSRDISIRNDSTASRNIVTLPGRDHTDAECTSNTTTPKLAAAGGPSVRPLWQQERDIIEHAIEVSGGNIAQAAANLEINASTIYRKRQTWADGVA